MNITENQSSIIIEGIRDFDLDHTFDNGQCFRWNREDDGSYTGVAFGKIVNVSLDNGVLVMENTTKDEFQEVWRRYFDLDRDYGEIKTFLSQKDPAMKIAISYGWGMRILRQDPWEMIISFIVSQNNNIPRIKKCIEGLCANHGSPMGTYRERTYYAFPAADELAGLSLEDLDICRLGYRAKYIIETARQIMSCGVESLQKLSETAPEEAYEFLVGLSGVGPKVANCIMLFGLGRYDSFPLDVWIKRVMHQVYCIEEGNTAKMKEYADSHFGNLGGIAQQYLFYYAREMNKKNVDITLEGFTGGHAAC